MEFSSEINWNNSLNEFICIFGKNWNVSKAKKILLDKPREIVEIDPSSFEPLLGGTITESGTLRLGIGIDFNRLESDEIDLSVPVIIVDEGNGYYMLIDGWHRLGKALIKKTNLFAVILNYEENKEILF